MDNSKLESYHYKKIKYSTVLQLANQNQVFQRTQDILFRGLLCT